MCRRLLACTIRHGGRLNRLGKSKTPARIAASAFHHVAKAYRKRSPGFPSACGPNKSLSPFHGFSLSEPVKRHRGEPGHTRDTRDTRTNLTTIHSNRNPTTQTPTPRARRTPPVHSGCAPALRSATLGCSFPRSPLPATSGRSPVRLSSIRETGVRAVLPHRPLRSRSRGRPGRWRALARRPIEADTGHTTPLPGSCVLSFPFPHTCQMPTSCTHRMGFGLRASAGHRRAGPMSARTARLRRVPAYSLRSGQNAHPPRAIPATTRGT